MLSDSLRFLLHHPYGVLWMVVAAEQLGLPIPAAPVLLGAGALAGADKLGLAPSLLLAVLACLLSDLVWYEAGRRRGGSILGLLCRVSLEPDSCVRRTEDTFARHGARTLLVAKFVPGLSTVAPPLAGVIGMTRRRFLALDAAGAALWSGAYLAVGYVFSDQLEAVAERVLQAGRQRGGGPRGRPGPVSRMEVHPAAAVPALPARGPHQPEELKQRLDSREEVVIVDLRHSVDFEADPDRIPGALRMSPDEVERRHEEIPATGTSSSTAPDPARPRAPGWRSF
jgi:membrane protein DedA with SNARE-associated domain